MQLHRLFELKLERVRDYFAFTRSKYLSGLFYALFKLLKKAVGYYLLCNGNNT